MRQENVFSRPLKRGAGITGPNDLVSFDLFSIFSLDLQATYAGQKKLLNEAPKSSKYLA
jgi:hypothetical protein